MRINYTVCVQSNVTCIFIWTINLSFIMFRLKIIWYKLLFKIYNTTSTFNWTKALVAVGYKDLKLRELKINYYLKKITTINYLIWVLKILLK